MAEDKNTRGPDVNEMFQKMGEKLGWFKHKNLNEAKQSMTLSAKKTKMKRENKDHGCSDGKRTAKLKKKIQASSAPKHTDSSVASDRPKLICTKARSFQILLSSDSDSNSTGEAQQSKGGCKKAVLQICSDSDDEFLSPAKAKNNSNPCIKENILQSVSGSDLQEFEPILNIKPSRNFDIDWNDTVVKNRDSLASFTIDLDNLGEPLVESTRIHRRSSVTYKQVIDSCDTSKEDENDTCDFTGKENTGKFIKEHLKHSHDKLPFLTSICEETKYVTAIETVEDTLNSSSQTNGEESKISSEGELCQRLRLRKTDRQHDKAEKAKAECNFEKHRGINTSDLNEEIEVVDAETQTDDYDGEESFRKESNKKIHKAYIEKTVVDNVSDLDDTHEKPHNVYNEDTVEHTPENVFVSGQDLPDDLSDFKVSEQSNDDCVSDAIADFEARFASTTIETCINEYSKQTIDYEFETESSLEAEAYNKVTGLCNEECFGQDTVTRDSNFPHFENDTVLGKETAGEPKILESENKPSSESDMEKFQEATKSGSEESMYEVCDAVTQTVETSCIVGNHGADDDIEKKSEQNNKGIDDFNEFEQNENSESDEESQGDFSECDGIENSRDKHSDSNDNKNDENTGFGTPAEKSDRKQKNVQKNKSDSIEKSWRSGKKYSSDSSSDGDLEAFFQKLRKPEEKKTSDSSSPLSMKDFIVEDEEMSSESEDSGFYLRETLEMENRKESKIVAALGSDDGSDDFSSKVYPSSVTKHKKRFQGKTRKQTDMSWSFSSDSEEERGPRHYKPTRKQAGTSKKASHVNDQKKKSSNNSNFKLKIDIDISTDSDDEVFNIKTSKREGLEDDAGRMAGDRKKKSNSVDSVSDNGINSIAKTKEESPAWNEEVLFKTPNILRKKKTCVDENKENEFKTPVSIRGKVTKTPKSSGKPVYISLSDTDSDTESSGFTVSLTDSSGNSKLSTTPLALEKVSTPLSLKNVGTPRSAMLTPTCSFLKSLSNTVDDSRRHSEAKRFVNNFSKYREELSAYLFKLYNRTIFENKVQVINIEVSWSRGRVQDFGSKDLSELPSDLPVIWNKRLLRTAGYCAYKKNAKNDHDRSTRIELSTKVCDNAERVRDTLIHELCHAAVWLLNGVNGGHGPYWKYWARHASRIHPELPAISVCHSYSINTKFTYRCKTCGYSIGRHSKSLDVKKKVCGYCRGEFELIRNSVATTPTSARSGSSSSTPRQPSKFALFVKDNYNSVKRQNQSLKHGDVMKELSKLFSENKISS